MKIVKSSIFILLAVLLVAFPLTALADDDAVPGQSNDALEDQEALEQQRLLEILKNAPPAPNPQPDRIFTEEESSSAEQRGIVTYDMETGEETITEGSESLNGEEVLTAPPFEGEVLPFAENGIIEGEDGVSGLLITPTPPVPVCNATSYPWNTIQKLLMRFRVGTVDYYYVCSAWAVGSFQVATAGHCLYSWDPNDDGNTSDRKWADEVWVWAGQGDVVNPIGTPDTPYGEAKATALRSYTGWTISHDYNHDWGVITLNRRDGNHTGWMGRETNTSTASLNFSGYPAETPYVPPNTLCQYFGYDPNNVRGYSTYRIYLDAFIYGGHSGGPSWRYDGTNRYVQGIHSTSNRVGYAEDTRLDNSKYDSIFSYIAEDEAARPPIPRPDLIEYFFDGNNRKDLLTNSAEPGDTIQVEYNVFNSGFASSNNFTVSFYLSTNSIISTGDTLIGTRTHSLSAWGLTNPVTTLTVPASMSPGIYYVGWIYSGGTTEYTTVNNYVVINNETLTVTSPSYTLKLTDTNGFTWRLNKYSSDARANYFRGIVENVAGDPVRNAAVSYLLTTGDVTMSADEGTGVPFIYLFKWTGSGGSGAWANVGNAGRGLVTVSRVAMAIAPDSENGIMPGEESDEPAYSTEATFSLSDSVGFSWSLSNAAENSTAKYYSGTVNVGSETRPAAAIYLKSNAGLSMAGDEGGTTSGVPFVYNTKWASGGSTGIWQNVSPTAGKGFVTVTLD